MIDSSRIDFDTFWYIFAFTIPPYHACWFLVEQRKFSVFSSHFFYYDKIRNGKRYPFANVKIFGHLIWKKLYDIWANSIETALQTCNLWTGQLVSYNLINWFRFNLATQTAKHFHICKRHLFSIWKWISFAISTFVIIEEMASFQAIVCKSRLDRIFFSTSTLTKEENQRETLLKDMKWSCHFFVQIVHHKAF